MQNRTHVWSMLVLGSLWGCSFSDVLGHGELDAALGGSSGATAPTSMSDAGTSSRAGSSGASNPNGGAGSNDAAGGANGGSATGGDASAGGASAGGANAGGASAGADNAGGASGAAGTGVVDPDACSEGTTDEQPCGIVRSGVRVRQCTGGTWGPFGTCSAPLALQVTSGDHHTCVLLDDGKVRCFGSNEQGQSNAPEGVFKQVVALDNRSCALSVSNQPVCWGAESAALPPGDYQSIGLGFHRCIHGLNADGQVVFSECGRTEWPGTYTHYRSDGSWVTSVILDGAAVSRNYLPSMLYAPEGRRFVDAVEDCGLLDDGEVDCADEPLPAGKYRALLSFDSLNMPLCGLREDGSIACRPDFNTLPVKSLPRSDLTSSATLGPYHACAITQDGDISCAGVYGRPVLPEHQAFDRLFAGEGSMCGERADGSVACWGVLQLELSPTQPFVDVSVGTQVLCGIDAEGQAACWGESNFGAEDAPQDERFRAIDVSAGFTCGVRQSDGLLSCWGDPDLQGIPRRWTAGSDQGAPFDDVVISNHDYACAQGAAGLRCGSADSTLDPIPLEIPALHDVQVAKATMCGLSIEGQLFCSGFFRELYTLSTTERFTSLGMSWPWDISQSESWAIMCGLRADGTSACYGYGADLRAVRHVPSEERFVDLALSNDFGCGLRANGSVRCWGGYDFGQHDPQILASAD